ncbi:MAG: glutamine amidotransferase [Desulfovibrio sp.]|jgi:GMP synthase (glutamine-hydrolysing)|nr:glutamine amidotransferase [Desulfovibrio sp.]
MRCLVLQHVCFEDLGVFAPVLREAGYTVRYVQAGVDSVTQDEWLAADLAVILGGPVGVGQEDVYPFLLEERKLARARLVSGRPLLGICLGAQLMAAALGARVYAGQGREIGWGGIELTGEGRSGPLGELADAPVLHWHGDTFDIPPGARRLAFTAITPNQAFSAGRGQLALQFHPEADAGRMETWLVGHCCELSASGFDPRGIREDALALGDGARAAGRAFLRRWLAEELSERTLP